MLLYLNTQSMFKTLLIILAVPFSAVGAIWLLYLLGYNMSIGVWVGLIALLGVDAETAVFMLAWYMLPFILLPVLIVDALLAYSLTRGRGTVAQVGRGMLIGCISAPRRARPTPPSPG